MNISYFIYIYIQLYNDKDYSEIIKLLGNGLLLAKSFAGVINLNFAFLFIFMNKTIVYYISNISENLPMNYHLIYHMVIISTIFIASLIHTGAHIYNYIILNTWLSITVITGYILVLLFLIIIIGSLPIVRKKCYNTFTIIHLSYILIVICIILHGSFCVIKTNNNTCSGPNFWKFIIIPFSLFICEKIKNIYNSNKVCSFVGITKHSNKIYEVELYKDDFEFKSGEYIYLKCPNISNIESHPFTIISNPIESGIIKVCIKISGDWTDKFIRLLNTDELGLIKIQSTNSYGNKLKIIRKYSHIIFIANGIGITNFMSIISSLPCILGHGNRNVRLKKIILYWVCRDYQDFNIFINQLHLIKNQLGDQLDLNFYITGDQRFVYPPFIFNYCRPNFKEELINRIETTSSNEYIRVFFCGSNNININIRDTVREINKQHSRLLYSNGESFN
jgi:NADPH oxidase